jgi:hypothetical protein
MNEKQVEFIVDQWALAIGLLVMLTIPTGWMAMLALGAAHAEWPVIPALGFGTTYVIVLALALVARCLK